MGLNEILLVVAALIPAIVLCVYVYKKDKVEKEPLGILLLLLFLGVMICFPAIYLELILKAVIDGVFGISALGGSMKTTSSFSFFAAIWRINCPASP